MTLPGVQLTVSGALLQANETMILDASAETDGNVRIFAGQANDTLKGSQGNDLIFGNNGADQLTGNGGSDVFRYQNQSESTALSMDHILDFTPGSDKIELERIDANTLVAGNQAFTWIGSGSFTGTGAASAGQLRAYQDSGSSWFVEGDTNGDGIADFVLHVTVQGPNPITQSDFFL